MKKLIFAVLVLAVMILGACGNSDAKAKEEYNKQINLVVQNKDDTISYAIEKERKLKREECNFKVYNQGDLVYIQYPLEKDDDKLMEDVYKLVGDEVKLSNSDEIKGVTPDYVETNVK
ncbi:MULTISPECIES: cystatin-like fold lipoprotein [unclassified Listeria]|uniref:cystatin-like fold lipoprotein n=1 Tax=unclassified Listeria TaxID=2642072 RepID=UPI000B58926B|nr:MULTISPECIES: cystatin-like fold lipoprotein [unclassified Listeria]